MMAILTLQDAHLVVMPRATTYKIINENIRNDAMMEG
jgi:hypothetical protein